MAKPRDDIGSRKGNHLRLSLRAASQTAGDPFAAVQVSYRALPGLNFDDVSTETELLGKTLSQPLIISSMTGGTRHGIKINTHLAVAAEAERVALGVGSQRIALKHPGAIETFRLVRAHAPTACIFANMGAIQLNYGLGIDDYRRVVDMVEADALYLHLNPLQEALQPGGDTDYGGLLEKIVELIDKVGVPVFIKEVGHGIDVQTARDLLAAGVAGIDVAGVGGTSYAWVEAERANNPELGGWFKDFGIPTEQAVRDIAPHKGDAVLVASGGIRNPVQGYKAHLLGADFYASTRPFLQAAMKSDTAVIEAIRQWRYGLQIALFATGQAGWELDSRG